MACLLHAPERPLLVLCVRIQPPHPMLPAILIHPMPDRGTPSSHQHPDEVRSERLQQTAGATDFRSTQWNTCFKGREICKFAGKKPNTDLGTHGSLPQTLDRRTGGLVKLLAGPLLGLVSCLPHWKAQKPASFETQKQRVPTSGENDLQIP